MSDKEQNIFSKVIISNLDIAIVLIVSTYLLKLSKHSTKKKLILVYFILKKYRNDNAQHPKVLNKCIRIHNIVYLHPLANQGWFAKSFWFSEILNVGMADKDCRSIT